MKAGSARNELEEPKPKKKKKFLTETSSQTVGRPHVFLIWWHAHDERQDLFLIFFFIHKS